jgi:hypothetical protein
MTNRTRNPGPKQRRASDKSEQAILAEREARAKRKAARQKRERQKAEPQK